MWRAPRGDRSLRISVTCSTRNRPKFRCKQSDVPADVTEAVKKERERFAGFQPDPANTEFGKYMQVQTNISGRNADRVIKRKAKERLAKLSVDKKRKPN